ncbi:MAG: calcium-binding protein [Alphaproteobacteria bacterium]
MGLLVASTSINMIANVGFYPFAPPFVTTAGPTVIQINTPVNSIQFFGGTFESSNGTVTAGIINSIRETVANATSLTNYEGTGFDIDVSLYNERIADLDSFGLRFALYSQNDTIMGSHENDSILGFDGNDALFGGLGNDTMNGNQGNDSVFGGDGNDSIHGGQGADTMDGDNGNDFATGSRGNDTVRGGEGNDFVYGGQENDVVDGGAGNDVIRGDLGDDVFTGGTGTDLFLFAENSGRDTIEDFNKAQGDQIGLQSFMNGSNIDGFEDLAARFSVQPDGVIINLGNNNTLQIRNVTPAQLDSGDFFFF